MLYSLRPAIASDFELLWQLHRDTLRDYVAQTWSWDDDDQLARFRAAFDPALSQIIAVDGVDVGVLSLRGAGARV